MCLLLSHPFDFFRVEFKSRVREVVEDVAWKMNDKDNEDRVVPFPEIKSTPKSQLHLRTRLNKLFFQSHVSLGRNFISKI